jgi:hypothetical protein
MADKSKYHITFVSISEGTDIHDLESLLEQRFKLSPARASLFFLGEDKITTSSLEKAKKFREYFLKQGVVVRIAPAIKKRPYVTTDESVPTAVAEETAASTSVDIEELKALQKRLVKAEELIANLQDNETLTKAKIKRLQEAIANHQSAIVELKAANAELQQVADSQTPEVVEAELEPSVDEQDPQISEPKPKSKRRAVWRVVRDSVIIAGLAGAWLFFSKDTSIDELVSQLPFIDRTPVISTALQAKPETMVNLNKLMQDYLVQQSTLTTAITAEALIHASKELQVSVEGLIAIAEITRCTDHQFASDMSFVDGQLNDMLWPRLTAAQLLQHQVINKDTLKLVQLGANGNCNSADSNKVVTKLAFDAYIQQHLQ